MEEVKIDFNLILQEYEILLSKLTRENVFYRLENEELKKQNQELLKLKE